MLIFTMISVAIDFSEKIKDYLEETCTKKEILLDYTLNFILYINGMLMPIYTLICVIFFTARMANNAELISILNAGVSFKRILRPYLVAGSIVTLIFLCCTHFLVPNGNKKRLAFERKYIDKHSDRGKKDNVHLFIGKNLKAFIRYYSPSDSMIRDLRIEKIENNEITSILEASSAQWNGKKQSWILNAYEIHSFNGLKETLIQNSTTPLDTVLNLYPRDFVFFANEKDKMTTPELIKSIQLEHLKGAFNPKNLEIELHRRTSEPFMVLILSVLGLSIAGRKVRGGMGVQLAIGIGLGAIYVFISRFSATFANANELPAIMGVWIPNFIYIMIALYTISKAQK